MRTLNQYEGFSALEAQFEAVKDEAAKKHSRRGFPGGAVVETLPANAGDTGSNPGLGRSHMLWNHWTTREVRECNF